MEDGKLNTQSGDDEEEFRDALDDFTFYDCEETFSDPIVSNGVVLPEDETVPPATLRLRRSRNASGGDSTDVLRPSSSVSFENFLRSGDEKVELSSRTKECEKKLENENSESVEPGNGLETAKDSADGKNNEKNDERSNLTGENDNIGDGLHGEELNLRENCDAHMSPLLTLAGIMIKVISFQFDMLVKSFMFPLRLIYYLYMLVFDPFGFLKRGREYLIQEMKSIWSLVFDNVSPFVYEWLKDHQAIWKLGLKCGWGLVWSSYVCSVLVALLVSAFVMGGLLIRGVVEEPMRMKTSLNFDYTAKSPVAFVPITAFPELSHDIYHEAMPGLAMESGSRAIPPKYKLQTAISLTLPESEYNQNLGIFQVRVDFLATDGKTLASSRRPCMLQYRSQPIRLLLTLLKVAPILTGYTTETQNLKINFRGFTEGDVPTACLRVVIEQRAEFLPGAGIPEIYAASLTLESKLPLLKRALWFWKKTLFVWISMAIFIMELVFALICCKPIIVPKIKLREATNRGASQNDRPSQN
ncbi:UNVERIFIED_CONTAM: Seipin-2 [Sesamum latifolium]|uniref:Seipin-2 n=1 Tax=Sesamum latifolium TaxID=2727402 RepID=A0AAW2WM16_9LAMI